LEPDKDAVTTAFGVSYAFTASLAQLAVPLKEPVMPADTLSEPVIMVEPVTNNEPDIMGESIIIVYFYFYSPNLAFVEL
jgi:hypothetical protein